MCVCAQLFSHVWLFAAPWNVVCQPPLSMECSKHEYWSGLSFPTPVDLLNPGIKPASLGSLSLAGRFFTASATWEAHSGYTNLHSHRQCRRIPFSPHLLQHLLFAEFYMMTILTDVRWYLTVLWFCISLLINQPYVHFFGEMSIRSFAHFSIGYLFFYWIVVSVCIFWKLLITSFLNNFNQFVRDLFILFIISFAAHKFINLFTCCFYLLTLETDLRKYWYNLCQRMFCQCSFLGIL